jgi:hypothetical protein
VWLGQYPELWRSDVVETSVTREDEYFDVLLLGGSVFAQAQTQLQRKLEKEFGEGIRVFGLAASGHTTRDSYLKHSRLSDKEFDLIVIYHGINDVRLNCCSPGTYRDDYAHCNWYASFTNHVNSARGTNATELKEIGAATTGTPSKELLDFGNVIRTPTAFRNNLQSIILHAENQKTAVLIITFSYYIPYNYSLARMESGQLDYGPGQYDLVVEAWGHPENVRTTIDAHNAVIRQLCARYRQARLLDLAKSFPDDGHHFSDVCHLTEVGIRKFVSRVGAKIVEIKQE